MGGNSKKIINFYNSFMVTHQTHIQGIVINISIQEMCMNIQWMAGRSADCPHWKGAPLLFASSLATGPAKRKGQWWKMRWHKLCCGGPGLVFYLRWILTHIIRARHLAALPAASNWLWTCVYFIRDTWAPIQSSKTRRPLKTCRFSWVASEVRVKGKTELYELFGGWDST